MSLNAGRWTTLTAMKQNWGTVIGNQLTEIRRDLASPITGHRLLITGSLALAIRAIKSNERLVPVSCTRCRASTSGLSTWWSSTALQGEIVPRLVSRLDAFSGYPFRI